MYETKQTWIIRMKSGQVLITLFGGWSLREGLAMDEKDAVGGKGLEFVRRLWRGER